MRSSKPTVFLLATLLTAQLACGSSAPPGGNGGGTGGSGSGGSRVGGSGGGSSPASGGSSGSGGAPSSSGTGGGMTATGGTTGTGGSKDAGSGTGGAGPGSDAGATETGGGEVPPAGDVTALDKACTPTLKLLLQDTGPKGKLFTDAVGGNADTFVQDIGRKVCRILYRNASEVRAANHVELQIRDYDGVAAKWGDVGDIGVEISTRHLQNVKNEGRDVGEEIAGILHHEMTHMYQHDDKPEASFAKIANMYESIADGVRIRNGFAPGGCGPTNKTGNWADHAYCSGGWFWVWAENAHPGFLHQLNGQMKGKDGKAWSPADATVITGKTLDALWTEYKGAACCSGNNRACCPVLPR